MFDPTLLLVWSFAGFATRALLFCVALGIDWIMGEPDWLWRRCPHPVVVFGRAISFFDARWNLRIGVHGRSRMYRGGLAIALLALSAAFIGLALTFAGPIVALAVLTVLLAARSLDDHIRAVARALGDGIEPARLAVSMIVGRDTSMMDEGDISRAAIETGAENLSDGVFAPGFWFLIAGLPGLLAYKMVNTADSMIGYQNARYRAFGCAAAKLDDLLNIIPARLTALLICGASIWWGRGARATRTMIVDGRYHASPNAGWPEAAMAGGLNVWLAGPRRYNNRVRNARRFHEHGKDADASAILRSLKVLMLAQVLAVLLLGWFSWDLIASLALQLVF